MVARPIAGMHPGSSPPLSPQDTEPTMEKLIFLVNDHDDAIAAVGVLHDMGINDTDISVIAREGTALHDLPDAQQEDGSDVVPAFARGAAAGGVTGLLAGIAVTVFAPAGIVLGGAAVLAATVGGASFGAFASALIGVSVPNSQLREYEDAVAAGQYLMVVEIEDERLEELKSRLTQSHAHVTLKGTKDFEDIPAV